MSYSNPHHRNHRDRGNRRRTRLPGRSEQSDHHHYATNNDGEDDGWEQVSNQRPSQRRNRQQQSNVQHRRGQAQSQFMIVLCGLPGSGKSHFATSLQSSKPRKFVRINQDQLKSRQRCEQRCRETINQGRIPVIDRCNFDTTQRRHFLRIAQEANIPVDCIFFDYDSGTCLDRCLNRGEHETITRKNARMVVSRMKNDLYPPNPDDRQSDYHMFQTFHVVRSFDDANAVMMSYLG